jgi:uncharacterized protein with PIN domain
MMLASSGRAMSDQSDLPVLRCLECHTPMRPQVKEAALLDLFKTTYRCESCNTETQHVFRRLAKWSVT